MNIRKGGVIHNANYNDLLCHFGGVNYNHNPDYCKAFGLHLRKLREDSGIGKRELARLAEMEYSQLSKLERGIINPTISTLYALSEALGIAHTQMLDFKFPSKVKK